MRKQATRQRLLAAYAAAVLSLAAAFAARDVEAQCTTEYTATLSSPLGSGGTTEAYASTVGTFDCGPFGAGSTCGSGHVSGSCTQSEGEAWLVSCLGACSQVPSAPENTADAVACGEGVELFQRAHVTTQCVAGICVSQSDYSTSQPFAAISAPDPETAQESITACGAGNFDQGHFVGAVVVTGP